MLKRTPLFGAHQRLGGKLIEFGGWEMPVQYTSIIDEHTAVRNAAGLFDISHMGEITVTGSAAADFLNYILCNDVRKLAPGQGQYTLMCNESGGAVDDLYAYRLADAEYLLIVNASRIQADIEWILQTHARFPASKEVSVVNRSDMMAAVALQGPASAAIISSVFSKPSTAGTRVASVSTLKKNEIGLFEIDGAPAWISRTGYTGEDGFEVVSEAESIEGIWDKLLETGRPHGLKPAGLGARDTLRTEVCYPLYGHELDENTGPIEAGLGFFVAFNKGDFLGRAALEEKKKAGPARKLVAFKTLEKSAPPRPGYLLWGSPCGGEQVGNVVSGTLSPSLGTGIGMAYALPQKAPVDARIFIEARGRRAPVQICKKPLYRKPVDPGATP